MNIKIRKRITSLVFVLCSVLTTSSISFAKEKHDILLENAKSRIQKKLSDQKKKTDSVKQVKFHPNDTTLPLVDGGIPTIKNLMIRAVNEIGKIMYIWGGGRNVPDGASLRILDTIGESPRWIEFATKIDSKIKSGKYNYNFKDYCIVSKDSKGNDTLGVAKEHIDKGFDCSGFMAWLLMNTLSGKDTSYESFVVRAKFMTSLFAKERGLGEFTDFGKIDELPGNIKIFPGDIVSMKEGYNENGEKEDESHVYLALGQYDDGSVILVDMSPPTVRIRGTRDRKVSRDSSGNLTSEAIRTAEEYMRNYFPDTYASFPNCTCAPADYRLDSKMHWDTTSHKIYDPDGYQKLTPNQVLQDLLGPIPRVRKEEKATNKKIKVLERKLA